MVSNIMENTICKPLLIASNPAGGIDFIALLMWKENIIPIKQNFISYGFR
jgi:hypothetical protein